METNDHALPSVDVLRVNGQSFVSGLYWQTLRKAVSFEAEAKEYGKKNGMDVVTIRKTQLVIQAGFAPKGDQALKGMYSLAAALAQGLGDNWLGAFPLNDGSDRYAFVAVLDGGIMPGRDIVGSREVVEEKLRETYGLVLGSQGANKWDRTIAPASWEFGGEALTLEELLHPRAFTSKAKLKPLSFGMTRRELAVYGGTMLGLVALSIGGLTVKHYLDAKHEQERLAAARALLDAQRAAAASHPAPAPLVPAHPWGTSAPAIDFARACDDAQGSFPLSVAGWVVGKSICVPGSVTASYKRNGSTSLDLFRGSAKRLLHSDAKVFDNGESAVIAGPLARMPASDEGLRADFDATTAFVSHFQDLGLKVDLLAVADPVPPASNGKTPPPAPLPWKTYSFKFETQLTPSFVLAGMELSGLRVHEIDVALKDGANPELIWTIAGELYVLR